MVVSAPDARQLTRLAVLFAEHGIDRDRRPDRLRLCSDHAGRLITSMSKLTPAEAAALEHRLQQLPRDGSLRRAAARLVRAEEEQAAARARLNAAESEARAERADGYLAGDTAAELDAARTGVGDSDDELARATSVARAILCTRGPNPPAGSDRAAVVEFAEQLAMLGHPEEEPPA